MHLFFSFVILHCVRILASQIGVHSGLVVGTGDIKH
jgi:hypothetical protein